MLSSEAIKAFVEAAFLPFRCVAEIWDYDQKLRLKVFDINDDPLVTVPAVVLSTLRDKGSLDSFVKMIKLQIDTKSK